MLISGAESVDDFDILSKRNTAVIKLKSSVANQKYSCPFNFYMIRERLLILIEYESFVISLLHPRSVYEGKIENKGNNNTIHFTIVTDSEGMFLLFNYPLCLVRHIFYFRIFHVFKC